MTVHRLSYADHIIVLNSEGRIIEQGGYNELSSTTKHAQSAPPEYSEVDTTNKGDINSGKNTLLKPPTTQASTGADRRTGEATVYKYYIRTVGWINFTIFISCGALFIFALTFPRKFWSIYSRVTPC